MNFRSTNRSARPGEAPPSRRARLARSGDGVLSIKPFRRLWIALSLSSLGDWLSILALLTLAPSVTNGGNLAKTVSVSGVWVVTLLPALLLGPVAGALADRFDRRITMIVGDVIRGLLFISIPLFPNLTWIFVAKFLAGVASQFWNPAAAASIPNLVPKEKLERANQLSQLMTYGTAPLAALLLAVLAWVATALSHAVPFFHTNKVDLALFFNGASYFVSAITVYFLYQIGKREHSGRISVPSTAKAIVEGWQFIRHTPVVRGLVIGMLGAFCAAGVVIGLASSYIQNTLNGGSAGFSLVFAMILIGLAIGMGFGSLAVRRLLPAKTLRGDADRVGHPAGDDRADPEPGRGHRPGVPGRRDLRHRLPDRVHHRRPGGGRRHPGPGVRLLPVDDPGHPAHGDRGRGIRRHRLLGRDPGAGRVVQRATAGEHLLRRPG